MDHEQFVRLGIVTEVALLIAAAMLSALWPIPIEQDPLRTTTGLTNLGAVLCGLAGGAVLSSWFWFSWTSHFTSLRKIQDFVKNQLAPHLSQCKAWELFAIAAFAGIGEEVLFRGVLQPRVGWFIASILFGLAHSITPTYVIVASVLGGLLGQLQVVCGNLWAPIIAHAVYDYIAFYLVVNDYRREQKMPPSEEA